VQVEVARSRRGHLLKNSRVIQSPTGRGQAPPPSSLTFQQVCPQTNLPGGAERWLCATRSYRAACRVNIRSLSTGRSDSVGVPCGSL
jgi:hypothetical protein